MANVFQDQVNATGGYGGIPFGGYGGGIPFSIPLGGFGGGCHGDGLGGLVGLAIAAAIFGNGGFGGRRDHEHCRGGDGPESTAALATVIAALNDRNDSNRCESVLAAVLAKLGTIEGAIPAVGCELQLALQSAVASLTAQGNANAASLTQQLNALQLGQLVQSQNILTAVANVDNNVSQEACTTRGAIAASEARITALINANELARANAQIVMQANEIAELRSDARHSDHRRELDGLRISIENNNNATAQQAQFQQQRQTDLTFSRLERDNHDLRCLLTEVLQVSRSTQSNILVGNQGVTTTGPQTANPTNVNAH